MRSRLAADIVTVLFLLWPLGVAALAVAGQWFPRLGTAPPKIQNWESLTEGTHRIGPVTAPVQIIEFADFQCPYCAEPRPKLLELRRRCPDDVAILYRHLPLRESHPHAFAAALASECAAAQDRFVAFQDLLYQEQRVIGLKSWREFAQEAGVEDLDDFEECVREERFRERVAADVRMADAYGIHETPTLIVNGVILAGVPPLTHLEKLVKEALHGARRAGSAGLARRTLERHSPMLGRSP